jgi:hypothetical protein
MDLVFLDQSVFEFVDGFRLVVDDFALDSQRICVPLQLLLQTDDLRSQGFDWGSIPRSGGGGVTTLTLPVGWAWGDHPHLACQLGSGRPPTRCRGNEMTRLILGLTFGLEPAAILRKRRPLVRQFRAP